MIEPRKYQIPAIKALVESKLGYIQSPAGSGKTIIAAFAIKCLEVQKCGPVKVLWLAYTKELLEQGRAACDAVALIGSQDFACVQGLDRIPEDIDLLIVDECHHVAAPSSKKLIRTSLDNIDGRWIRRCITWGLTATPIREDGESIEPVIGPCLHVVPDAAIKAEGGVLPGAVVPIEFDDRAAHDLAISEAASKIRAWMNEEQRSRVMWQAVKKYCVVECKRRNEIAAELANERIQGGDSVIVLVETIDQGKGIVDMIDGAVMLHSTAKGRSDIVKKFRAGDLRCVVATTIADEGFDVPIAGVLIMARAGKAKGRTIQRVGRVLRPHPGKDSGLIYDFKDSTHGMLKAQWWQRMRTYKEQGFKVQNTKQKDKTWT